MASICGREPKCDCRRSLRAALLVLPVFLGDSGYSLGRTRWRCDCAGRSWGLWRRLFRSGLAPSATRDLRGSICLSDAAREPVAVTLTPRWTSGVALAAWERCLRRGGPRRGGAMRTHTRTRTHRWVGALPSTWWRDVPSVTSVSSRPCSGGAPALHASLPAETACHKWARCMTTTRPRATSRQGRRGDGELGTPVWYDATTPATRARRRRVRVSGCPLSGIGAD